MEAIAIHASKSVNRPRRLFSERAARTQRGNASGARSAAQPRVGWQVGFAQRYPARPCPPLPGEVSASEARSAAQPRVGWQAGFARRYPVRLDDDAWVEDTGWIQLALCGAQGSCKSVRLLLVVPGPVIPTDGVVVCNGAAVAKQRLAGRDLDLGPLKELAAAPPGARTVK